MVLRPGESSRAGIRWLPLAALSVVFAFSACGIITPPPASISPPLSPAGEAQASPVPTAIRVQPSDASTIADACTLLSPAELESIVGGPVPVAKPLPAGGWVAAQCAWSGPTSSLLVSIGTADSFAAFKDPATPDAKSKFSDYRQRFAAGSAAEQQGLGEGAVLSARGLAAYTGGTYLEIMRSSLTDDQLVAVARRILSQL